MTRSFMKETVIPMLFIAVFPFLGIFLAVHARDGDLSRFRLSHFMGNRFTWTSIGLLIGWALTFQKFSRSRFDGPKTNFGFTPRYAANGFAYFWTTIVAFLTLNVISPDLSETIVLNLPELLGNLASVAFLLCLYLWWKGKYRPSCRPIENPDDKPVVFEFYRGMELHPRLLDVDVKQLTNCRVGLMLWQILIVAFLIVGHQRTGFNAGHVVNVLLQSVYLAKFYWWETGYFNTLDITMDRAGFYICWGCLAFLPIGYTYSTYYFIRHPPTVSSPTAVFICLIGLASVYLNYEVDRQKEHFRKTSGKCKIFGRDAAFMEVEYRDSSGAVRKSKLLLSGFWGTARHLNYVFEMMAALAWNLPGWGLGPLPFLYNVYLFVLLTHRVFRDEDKCLEKYGQAWRKYCKAVPYRLIPYVF